VWELCVCLRSQGRKNTLNPLQEGSREIVGDIDVVGVGVVVVVVVVAGDAVVVVVGVVVVVSVVIVVVVVVSLVECVGLG